MSTPQPFKPLRYAMMISVYDNETKEQLIDRAFNASHSVTVEEALRGAAEQLEERALERGDA
jgi:hypothetical protein